MGKETKELLKRNELPEDKTWRLEDIFETDELWEKELKSLEEDIKQFEKYQGKLSESADTLYDLLSLQDELSERLGKVYTYAHMRYDQDTTNSFYQGLDAQAETLITVASSEMSFITPEILEMDEEKLASFLKEKEELQLYKKTLDEITRQRPHVLSKAEEALLAEASEPMSSSSQTFGMLNNADLTFPAVENEK